MARKRTFSHFFFEKKCVFVPKSLIWLSREGRDVLGSSVYFSSVLTKYLGNLEHFGQKHLGNLEHFGQKHLGNLEYFVSLHSKSKCYGKYCV